MNKNKLIPELRFPEFKNEGEWKEKEIGKLFKFKQGVQVAVENQFVLPKNEMVRFIRIVDITSNSEVPRYIENPGEDHLVKMEDLFMIRYGTPGLISIGFEGVVANNLFRLIWNVDKRFEPKYWFYSFQKIEKLIYNLSGSSSMPAISFSTLDNLSITFPHNPQEQQKIASCLSSLDEVIAAHSQKLALLKDHKKGLMQNLFPNSITNYESSITSTDDQFVIRNSQSRNLPKYRFKEFEKDGEWVEKKLGDVADFINGKAYKQEELLATGKYRVLRVGNFFTNNEWYYSDLELDEDKYCEKDDLLYAWSASFGPHIWKEEKVIYHYHIWKVKNKIGVDRQFLYNLLDYETFRMKAKSLNGFALMHITKGTIEAWESMIPNSEKEQQKIASCLSSLDTLITAQSEKIEQLQLHKKGLMQGLFPKIND